MAEEKKEAWLNYLALMTVIFAVCATLSTFKGGGYSTRSVMSQSQASDEWAFYQSKSIKSYMYQMQNILIPQVRPLSGRTIFPRRPKPPVAVWKSRYQSLA
jgi:hypothetical protein